MSSAALALVLAAAVFHAAWNVLAKRARGGLAFTWLTFALSTLLYLPVVASVNAFARPRLNAVDWLFIGGNAVTHAVYFFFLRRGYAAGDLSLVYPLARGTGPPLASLAALAIFGERPGPLGFAGLALIVGGIFLGSGGAPPAGRRARATAVDRIRHCDGRRNRRLRALGRILGEFARDPPLVYDLGAT